MKKKKKHSDRDQKAYNGENSKAKKADREAGKRKKHT